MEIDTKYLNTQWKVTKYIIIFAFLFLITILGLNYIQGVFTLLELIGYFLLGGFFLAINIIFCKLVFKLIRYLSNFGAGKKD